MYPRNPIVLNGKSLPAASRLVVLIPDFRRIDPYALAKRVRDLASPEKMLVLYVTLVKTYDDEMPAVHTLAQLSAITHSARVRADILVETNISWLALVRRVCAAGDILLTLPDHAIRAWGFMQKPIAQFLADKVEAEVYILAD